MMIKQLLIGLAVFMPLSLMAQDSEKDANLLMFAAELESFFHNARQLKENPGEYTEKEQLAEVENLEAAGRRIANIYFAEITGELKPRLDAYLSKKLRQNSNLEEYQVLIGNSFVNKAQGLDTADSERKRRVRMMSTIGGTLVGLATGGALLYFKSEWFGTGFKAVAKMGAVVGLSGAAGYGLGYAGGYVTTSFVLKTDVAVTNAREFLERYPNGSDFLDELLPAGDEDLLEALGEVDEVAYAD